jgi:deoxyribodipyrimidine photolyase-related protein
MRLILWDQLSSDISCLRDVDKKHDVILFCEVREECVYVKHHKKKLVFLLSAMRHFAAELTQQGYHVYYVKLDDKDNTQSLADEIRRLSKKLCATKILLTLPGEYRIYSAFIELQKNFEIDVSILEDDRFLASRDEFQHWARDKKLLRMELFYREMRKKYHILMDNNVPEGGKWNYDVENRHFPKAKIKIPPPYQQVVDEITQDVIHLVEKYFADHFGEITPFHYAVTRKKALQALKSFICDRLPHFGDYQDVMMEDQPWLFHSHISFYINAGLLTPIECIKAAEAAYYRGTVTLPASEGFIRQILGWREFMRGIYWLKMPSYKASNFLKANRHLPNFYWTGDTEMNCIKQCVSDTKANAYAHHIQRLMVLGNFALLAGIHPDDVNEWYLIVYADAHEWVELPNVTGMILFADGGYLASKPYAASGAYINKMSNYCKNCVYQVKLKNGPKACPFNYLYWNFLLQHRNLLKTNKRLSMVYSILARMSHDKIADIYADSKAFLTKLKYEY